MAVYTPCPISTWGMISVIAPRWSMRMNALGAKTPASAAAALASGSWKPSNSPPPTAAPTFRKARLDSGDPDCGRIIQPEPGSSRLCGMLDGVTNPDVGAAAADVACHGRIDVRVVRTGCGIQQRHRRHDLPGLAVAALD